MVRRIRGTIQEHNRLVFYDRREREFYTWTPGQPNAFVWDVGFTTRQLTDERADDLFEEFQADPGRFPEVTITGEGVAFDDELVVADLEETDISDLQTSSSPIKEGSRWKKYAVFAAISVDHKKIGIVGTHLDVFPDVHVKASQIERVFRSLPSSLRHLVVAGDFNTFFKREYKAVAHSFENAGMLSATDGDGWSYEYPLGIKRLLDQIWIKGMDAGGFGRIEDGAASDHLLIWAKVKISSSPVETAGLAGAGSSPVHPIADASRGRDEDGAEGVRNHIEFAKMQLKKMLREFMAREEPRRISSTALRYIYLLVDIALERMTGRLGLGGRQKEQLKSELELSLFGEFIRIKKAYTRAKDFA